MKTINKIIPAIIVIASVCSCSISEVNPDTPVIGDFGPVKLEATSGNMNKTALDGLSVIWKSGDEVSAYSYDNMDASDVSDAGFSKFTATSVDGTSAVLSGTLEAEKYVAYFPYVSGEDADHTTHYIQDCTTLANLDGKYAFGEGERLIRTWLPEVQSYSAGTFGPTAAPMLAVNTGSSLTFQNLAAVLKIQLKGDGSIVKSISVKSKDDPICGRACFNIETLETNMMSADPSNDTVVLDCGSGVALNSSTATAFYVVIPAQLYLSGLEVKVSYLGYGEKTMARTTSTTDFEAGKIYSMPEITLDKYVAKPDRTAASVIKVGLEEDIATVIANAASGSVIMLPRGYEGSISTKISCSKQNLTILGAHEGEYGTGARPKLTIGCGPGFLFSTSKTSNYMFEGIDFVAAGATEDYNYYAFTFQSLSNNKNIVFDNCIFRGFYNCVFYVKGGNYDQILIQDCLFDSMGWSNAVFHIDGESCNVSNILIDHSNFSRFGPSIVKLASKVTGFKGAVLRNCLIYKHNNNPAFPSSKTNGILFNGSAATGNEDFTVSMDNCLFSANGNSAGTKITSCIKGLSVKNSFRTKDFTLNAEGGEPDLSLINYKGLVLMPGADECDFTYLESIANLGPDIKHTWN